MIRECFDLSFALDLLLTVVRSSYTAEAYLYCMRDGSFTGQTIITDSGMLLLWITTEGTKGFSIY